MYRNAARMMVALLALLAGCGEHDDDVRVYREVRVSAEAPTPRASPHGAPPAPAVPPPPRAALAWEAPEGWTETPGGGMRLASFAVDNRGEGLCTLIVLSGPAGGLEANVARWMEQLGLPVPAGEALASFLDGQERFETATGMPVVLVDLASLSREQGSEGETMMVGVVSLGRLTGFLKLTGPASLLETEKENLRALCRSVRPAS